MCKLRSRAEDYLFVMWFVASLVIPQRKSLRKAPKKKQEGTGVRLRNLGLRQQAPSAVRKFNPMVSGPAAGLEIQPVAFPPVRQSALRPEEWLAWCEAWPVHPRSSERAYLCL